MSMVSSSCLNRKYLLQDVEHEFLEELRLALFLEPREDAAGQLGEVVHPHVIVERPEQGVHQKLENLQRRGYLAIKVDPLQKHQL
jgi:hypothetical protein